MAARVFSVHIQMGNAEMLDALDVAQALREVAADLSGGKQAGLVTDRNGNTVGAFVWGHEEELEAPKAEVISIQTLRARVDESEPAS